MAGLSGPVRSEPPPQANGVLPGSREDGDVRAATDGSLVPPGPGVSGGAPPKDCSKGFGSRLSDPASGLLK